MSFRRRSRADETNGVPVAFPHHQNGAQAAFPHRLSHVERTYKESSLQLPVQSEGEDALNNENMSSNRTMSCSIGLFWLFSRSSALGGLVPIGYLAPPKFIQANGLWCGHPRAPGHEAFLGFDRKNTTRAAGQGGALSHNEMVPNQRCIEAMGLDPVRSSSE